MRSRSRLNRDDIRRTKIACLARGDRGSQAAHGYVCVSTYIEMDTVLHDGAAVNDDLW